MWQKPAVEVPRKQRKYRRLAAAWHSDYNHYRPHSSLDYQPPARFAAATIAAMVPAASAPATPALQQHTRGQEALPIPQPLLS